VDARDKRGHHDSAGMRDFVMAGLDPAIHAFLDEAKKTWMPATSAGMTTKLERSVKPEPSLRRKK
jgi:hypothetical protein